MKKNTTERRLKDNKIKDTGKTKIEIFLVFVFAKIQKHP